MSPPLGPGGEMVTDSFYFVRQPLPGNGTVTARVTSLAGVAAPGIAGGTSALQSWAKAGIIIKASLRQASSPRWLRLVRSGDTLTGCDSADGTHWTLVGAARLPGSATAVQAGIFTASPDSVTDENAGSTLASAVFDHVTVPGTRPGGQWTGQDVGADAAYKPLPGDTARPAGSSRY